MIEDFALNCWLRIVSAAAALNTSYLLLGVSSAYEQGVPGSGLPGDERLHGELPGAVLLQVEQQQRQVRRV